MIDIENNKKYLIIYISLILLIVIGGFLLIHYQNKLKSQNTRNNYENIKIDKAQDYIYYSDANVISSQLRIIYQTINININTQDAQNVAKTLNETSKSLENSVKLISQTSIPEDNPPISNKDDIYSARLQTYQYYLWQNRLILLADQYNYDCYEKGGAHNITPYIFNLLNGNLLTTQDLLEEYQISEQELINIATEKLNNLIRQVSENNPDLIKSTETLSQLKDGKYILYINKHGQLTLNIIVITNEINYNEDIIIK